MTCPKLVENMLALIGRADPVLLRIPDKIRADPNWRFVLRFLWKSFRVNMKCGRQNPSRY